EIRAPVCGRLRRDEGGRSESRKIWRVVLVLRAAPRQVIVADAAAPRARASLPQFHAISGLVGALYLRGRAVDLLLSDADLERAGLGQPVRSLDRRLQLAPAARQVRAYAVAVASRRGLELDIAADVDEFRLRRPVVTLFVAHRRDHRQGARGP